MQAPIVSDPDPECEEQGHGNKKKPVYGDPLQDVLCSPGSAAHADDNEETIVTSSKFIPLHSLQRSLMTR